MHDVTAVQPTYVEAMDEGMESAGAGAEIDDEDSEVVVVSRHEPGARPFYACSHRLC